MSSLAKSKAALSSILNVIKKLLFITNIFVQSLFLVFYVYSIYTNLFNTLFLIAYSILFVITCVNFIRYLITYIKQSKKPKIFSRVIRICKYTTNGALVAVNTYELIFFGATFIGALLLISSAISFFIHVFIELVRILLEKRVAALGETIKNTINIPKRKEQLKQAKTKFYQSLDRPLQSIANNLSHDQTEQNNLENTTENIDKENLDAPNEVLVTKNTLTTNEVTTTANPTTTTAEIEKGKIREHIQIIKQRFLEKKPKKEIEPQTVKTVETLSAANQDELESQVVPEQKQPTNKTSSLAESLAQIKNRFKF